MKKRKRKMKSNGLALCQSELMIGSAVVVLLLTFHLATHCAFSRAIKSEPTFDQHRLLNASATTAEAASNSSSSSGRSDNLLQLPHQRPLRIVSASEPHRQITLTSNLNDLISEEPQLLSTGSGDSVASQLNESSYLSDHHYDDLLAVESSGSGRLLSLSKPPLQISPPYAATNLTANHTDLQQRPLNDSQLAKLYRSPLVPTFIGRYGGRQDLRVLQPSQQESRQPQSPLRYQPVSTATLLPVTTWHSLYFPRPPLRSTSTTTTTTTPQPELVNEDSFRYGSKVNNRTLNRATSSSVDYWRAENGTEEAAFQSPHSRSHHFPRLLGQSSNENAEDSFERSLALGSYQRTNASNMSWPQLLRQATESNVMESLMVTNRSMVSLLCDTNDMLIRLKFKQPFRGLVSSSLDSGHDGCRLAGTGAYYYEMRVSLQDCGTRQEMPRLFINNIRIQFHQSGSFDTIDDELKTIICSYPIKPRAPPPPDLPAVLPERIVEAPSEPARLVYYEPLVLISGLLLLSLTLLGFTTGAYVFAKRYRSSRARFGPENNLSPTSSRIYRTSPAQAANFLVAPPLIGVGKGANKDKRTATEVKYPDYPGTANRRPDVDELRPAATISKSGGGRAVSLNPGESSDSLGRNDSSSITTIEIPYNSPKNFQSDTLNRSVELSKTVTTTKSSREFAPNQVEISSTSEQKPTTQQQQVSKTVLQPKQSKISTASEVVNSPEPSGAPESPHNNSIYSSPAVLRSTNNVRDEEPSTERRRFSKMKYKTAVAREREVQRGISRTRAPPTYGSLRSRLTSPREYKRLQGIARLFDEILIESREDQGDKGSVLVYKSRLSPSKYKSKILDTMGDEERRQLGNMLVRDELFRSYVVDSSDRDTFHRKLRENPAYSDKFSPETWLLLEEIVLDPDVNNESTTSAILSTNELESEGLSSSAEQDSTRAIVLDNMDMNEIKSSQQVNYQSNELDRRLEDRLDRESILVEVDAREPNVVQSANRDDSLDSDAKTVTLTRQHKGSSELSVAVPVQEVQHKDVVRVSQFNSTAQEGGMTGTLINIDSVTNFTSSKDFSTFTRSRIEHTRYEAQAVDSLPYADERIGEYEYANETMKMSPRLSSKSTSKRLFERSQQTHNTLTREDSTTSGR